MNIQTITILLICLTIFADPEPSGGSQCTNDIDCGGINAGICTNITNGTGSCVCPENLGKPDCSYKRISKNFAGRVQLLFLVGIGGIGEFVLGNDGVGFWQLIITFPLLGAYFIGCAVVCEKLFCKNFCSRGCVQGIQCLKIYLILSIPGIMVGFIFTILIFQGGMTDNNGYFTY